jgi:hypothetical protein
VSPAGGAPRFDVAALRAAAGDKVFARGAAYAKEGRVRLITVDPGQVRAEVVGSEVYAAMLEGDGRDVSGACECRAFEDWGFCKHLVAVALTVNAATPADLAAAEAVHPRIAAHLRGLDHEALVGRIMDLAAHDPALRRELELEVAVADEDEDALFARFAKAIDAATDVGEFVGWQGAGTVAGELLALTVGVERMLELGRAGLALRLADRLLDHADDLLEHVDDSDGEVQGALAAWMDLHLRACLAAKPDPLELAGQLFERQIGSDYGLWEDAAGAYTGALGPEGLAEHRRLAEAAWRELPPAGGGFLRNRLFEILDGDAMHTGDLEARIALHASVAASAWNYLQIAQMCVAADRETEALRWADEGLWKTEDQPDARLVVFTARLRRRLGRADEAEALLWAEFKRAPTLELYGLLKEGASDARAVTVRCVETLRSAVADQPSHGWGGPGDLLVQILSDAGRLDEAWAVVIDSRCTEPVVERLARSSEATHPDQALAVYAQIADRALATVNNAGYEAAIKQIARAARLRCAIGRDDEQAAYIESLATRHKAKRNFIRLLNDSASWPKA